MMWMDCASHAVVELTPAREFALVFLRGGWLMVLSGGWFVTVSGWIVFFVFVDLVVSEIFALLRWLRRLFFDSALPLALRKMCYHC